MGNGVIAVKAVVWFVIVLVHGTVTIFMPFVLLYADILPLSDRLGVVRFVGVVPVFVGVLILLWSVCNLVVTGKGTPAPFDPPKGLVVTGLYRFVRNPMYVGDLLVLLGESLLFESFILLIYSLLILSICHLFVILYEEPILKRKFGESYEQYCNTVPRWITSRHPYK